MRKEKLQLDIINHSAAGIDVGSRSHFVAIGQDTNDIREFGVYAQDLKDLCLWLKESNITTVALESTGNYWQNLFTELINFGFKVTLANGKFTKHPKGKKTDVKDARWIQQLHTLGLLSSSFLPDEQTEVLRTYSRHRDNLIDLKSNASLKMQKFLRLLNFRLDVVVNDITGLTGLKIIDAICNGTLDPLELAKNRHFNCKKSENEIAKALHSNHRADYLFGLKQEYQRFLFYQNLILDCDAQIALFLDEHIANQETIIDDIPKDKPYKRVNKNTIKSVDLNRSAYQYFGGVDLFEIPGVSHSTILTLMGEIGEHGFSEFHSAKQFASWARLAPNNKISGGKVLSNRTPKGSNRVKTALRDAANVIARLKDTPLSSFFAKIAYRKGRQSAISATARKLAVIIWNMVVFKQPYKSNQEYLFLDQKRKQIALLRKKITKFEITNEDLGLSTT